MTGHGPHPAETDANPEATPRPMPISMKRP